MARRRAFGHWTDKSYRRVPCAALVAFLLASGCSEEEDPAGMVDNDAGADGQIEPGEEVGPICRAIEEVVPEAGLACAGDLGDPVPGTPGWDMADRNNRECSAEGTRIILNNPAAAAAAEANVEAGDGHFWGDPFRAPHRWAGKRGSYELTTYTDRNGIEYSAALLGPLDPNGGPYPGVLIVCHICLLTETADGLPAWYWAAQPLAEAGYVVMYFSNLSNAFESAVDATDFFLATPDNPSPHGGFNPWHARLDRSRLAILGHSGAGGVALNVGLTDPRFDAVVAWDPAPVYDLPENPRTVPTMVQVAEYDLFVDDLARSEKPDPSEFLKFGFFDRLSAAGADSMQIAVRASRHTDWQHYPEVFEHGIFGETVGLYYTLAWLDRYLAPARVLGAPLSEVAASGRSPDSLSEDVASDALRRLTDSGSDCFDSSADMYSIGAGFYDPEAAQRAGDPEAGNVPIKIGGLPIRDLLSFQYDSKYFLDGGDFRCADMRAGCPGASE